MSRIGKRPIAIPQGVEVSIEGRTVSVKGPLGQLTKTLPPGTSVSLDNGQLLVHRASDARQHKAMHGLARALLANMVEGVTQGFKETLILTGVGYRAQLQGNRLQLSVGTSHPIRIEPMEGVRVEVEGSNRIIVSGVDKQKVGQFAANLKAIKPMSRYGYKDGRGKGIRLERETPRFKEWRKAL